MKVHAMHALRAFEKFQAATEGCQVASQSFSFYLAAMVYNLSRLTAAAAKFLRRML
jgi:hypothetical protein